MDIQCLLPSREYSVDRVSLDEATLRVWIRPCTEEAQCPCCGTARRRVHSHYRRVIQDVAWGGRAVQSSMKTRRFFCDNPACQRRIFAERLGELVAPHARRTERLVNLMQQLGLLCGGSVGMAILRRLSITSSRWTVLRDVRKVPLAGDYTPGVLGVDDRALRRGHRYGTILVDLEAAQVIDLLPDREADTLVAWLRAHPGVEVISRDRAGAYAQAARQGAPAAIQVADRWHLLKNLGEALTNLFGRHRRALKQLSTTLPADAKPPAQKTESAAYQRRQGRFEQVRQLRENGLTITAIANLMNLDRKTIRKYLNAQYCPGGKRASKRVSKLAPYHGYLLGHGLDGQRTVRQLWRDIQTQGFEGSLTSVATFMAAAHNPTAVTTGASLGSSFPTAHQADKLTPRRATWLVLSRPDALSADQRQQAKQIAQLDPEITHMVAEAQAFAQFLRERSVEVFDPWLQRACQSTTRELRTFARGIQRDYAAVRAALELPFSNGPVEGNVNRLKFVKRSMFGRANFDLLRLRVLYHAPP